MAVPAQEIQSGIIAMYKAVMLRHLPADFSKYEETIGGYSRLLLAGQPAEADFYLFRQQQRLPEDEYVVLVEALDQFCNYLVSRGYVADNPLCPTGQPAAPARPAAAKPVMLQLAEPRLTFSNEEEKKECPVEEIMSEFFRIRTTEGNKIEGKTPEAYALDFAQFIKFLKRNGHPNTLNNDTIRAYSQHLAGYIQPSGKPYARGSIMRKKNSLRALISFAIDEGMTRLDNKYKRILYCPKSDRTPEKPHRALDLDECDALIRTIANQPSYQQIRVLLPLLAGPRPEETVLVKRFNCDTATDVLRLTETKNGLPRDIPLPGFFAELLKKHLRNFEENDYIMATRQSEHIGPKRLTQIIQQYAKLAGLKRDVTAHDLRKTFGTNHYRYGGVDLKTLKDYLGHEDVNTTAKIYIEGSGKNTDIDLKTIYEKWGKILNYRADKHEQQTLIFYNTERRPT